MKIIHLLTDLGFNRHESKALQYLLDNIGNEVTAREIERKMDMRQPEVSLALKSLKKRGWIATAEPSVTKIHGRPTHLLWLRISAEEIYQEISVQFEKDITKLKDTLDQLKTAMTSVKPVQSEIPSQGKQLSLLESNQDV